MHKHAECDKYSESINIIYKELYKIKFFILHIKQCSKFPEILEYI